MDNLNFCSDFLDLFEQIDCINIKDVAFPLPFHHEKLLLTFTKDLPPDEDINEKDILYIPPFEYSVAELKQAACQVLLASTTDRNIVVYDSQSGQGEISSRLLNLVYMTMRCNHKPNFNGLPVTDLFYCKSNAPIEVTYSQTIKHHPVGEADWNYVEKYYLNDLQGSYASEDKNLLLAVSAAQPCGDFLCAHLGENKYGMAILDNTRVMLASY